MALHDFDKAHAIHAALLALLLAEPGGSDNPAVFGRVSALCDAAVDAVNDVEGRVAIRGVKSLAALLYSDDGHAGVISGSLVGAEAVRFQMMNALSAFRGRVDALERRPPSRPEVPAIASKKFFRVLIVDDNRDAADSLAMLLDIAGYHVSVAYSALEGLESAKRIRPVVVISDIGLPDSDGFALAEALRANPITSSARLIALTAYGAEGDRIRSRQAGFDLHLVKPVDATSLLQLLEQAPKEQAASPAAPSEAQIIDIAAHQKPLSGTS